VLSRLDGLVGEFVVVKARDQVLPELSTMMPLSVVEDLYPESGPLGGLYTGLSASRCDAVVAVACDMPLLRPELLQELFRLFPGHDVVVPVNEHFAQPLCAVYSRACVEPIRHRLEAGQLKLMSFYEDMRVLEVAPSAWRQFDPDGLSFQNLNRDEDLAKAEAILKAEMESG
jgi:molybdopterin-guanine dinucleotide biosynthesis protein A